MRVHEMVVPARPVINSAPLPHATTPLLANNTRPTQGLAMLTGEVAPSGRGAGAEPRRGGRCVRVTPAVRYRPVRSLLLLGLLVLVSLFVLFTLSQMAVVQHTMMAHLGTGVAPGVAGGGSGAAPGGARGPKGPQRPWRSQFNQFKIEPLLVRNAPSVEVNLAMASNLRMANQIAAIIIRNSLLVSHSAHSTLAPQTPRTAQGKAQVASSPHNLPSHDQPNMNTNTHHFINTFYNSSTQAQQMRSGLHMSDTLHPGQQSSTAGQGQEASTPVGARGRAEQEGAKGIAEPSPLYEPIDSDVMELAARKNDSNRKRNPSSRLSEEQLRKLPVCPEIPPGLQGHLNVDLDFLEKLRLEDVLQQLSWVSPGGTWSPVHDPLHPCLPRHKVAVVLPYRDRLHHLIILLSWLHPILRRQQLEYTVYVAEQTGNATFNKGSIMNAGFMEAWQRSDAGCFVFHDVDLLPEDDRNMYSCPQHPRHLSVGVDTLGYKLPYFLLMGGVLSVRGDQFLRLNGYSNMYWGWGGEDDDMGYRQVKHITAHACHTLTLKLILSQPATQVRGKLLRTSGRRYRLDGLNTLKYTLHARHRHPLFTHLLLDVGTPPENLLRLDTPAHPPPRR
ncbi:Beta-1,4-galactosyltransferase 1 [Chionoecetes opilio]|uniref:Beta-1,4-galactosyltransferase 1 n=1 Tax=Chionoecetes opilio TaxID=41210 RepID=A0A8J8WAG4_CHIOP|nr:Beta-1,4-galactosyltransferase 1 [Chionoecetes opilio]